MVKRCSRLQTRLIAIVTGIVAVSKSTVDVVRVRVSVPQEIQPPAIQQPPEYPLRSAHTSSDYGLNVTMSRTLDGAPRSTLICSLGNCFISNVCIGAGGLLFIPKTEQLPGDMHAELAMLKVELQSQLIERDRGLIDFEFSNGLDFRAPGRKRTAVVINRYAFGNNCGHTLGDEAFAITRLVLLFEEKAIAGSMVDDIWEQERGPSQCDFVLDPLFANQRYLKDSAPAGRPQCYSRVYFGTRGLSYVQSDHPQRSLSFLQDMRMFRAIYHRYATAKLSKRPNGADSIVVMEKKRGEHLSNIGNREQIVGMLEKVFASQYKVVVASWTDYDLADQIRLMARTKVMISLPGSDVMNAVFIPDGGYLFMYCRVVDGRLEHSNELRLWFSRIDYIKTIMNDDCVTTDDATYDYERGQTIVDIQVLQERLQNLLLE